MTMMVILSSSTKILLTESWMEAAEGVFLFHAISSLWTIMIGGYVDYAEDDNHFVAPRPVDLFRPDI